MDYHFVGNHIKLVISSRVINIKTFFFIGTWTWNIVVEIEPRKELLFFLFLLHLFLFSLLYVLLVIDLVWIIALPLFFLHIIWLDLIYSYLSLYRLVLEPRFRFGVFWVVVKIICREWNTLFYW